MRKPAYNIYRIDLNGRVSYTYGSIAGEAPANATVIDTATNRTDVRAKFSAYHNAKAAELQRAIDARNGVASCKVDDNYTYKYELSHLYDILDRPAATEPATAKQIAYLKRLAKGCPDWESLADKPLNKMQASQIIDYLASFDNYVRCLYQHKPLPIMHDEWHNIILDHYHNLFD